MTRALVFATLSVVAVACGAENVDLKKELGKDAASDSSCAPSGCGTVDTDCSSRSACCSGLCEPQGDKRTCLDFCKPLGAQCDKAADCCSLGCSEQNRCTNVVCAVTGASCAQDIDCCSGHCDGSVCSTADTICGRTGERCSQGDECCSGVCDQQTQRCDLGPGQCRAPLFPCMTDSDCCAGKCVANADGIPVCASSCFPDGSPCSGDSDCCGGACNQNNRCGPATCDQ